MINLIKFIIIWHSHYPQNEKTNCYEYKLFRCNDYNKKCSLKTHMCPYSGNNKHTMKETSEYIVFHAVHKLQEMAIRYFHCNTFYNQHSVVKITQDILSFKLDLTCDIMFAPRHVESLHLLHHLQKKSSHDGAILHYILQYFVIFLDKFHSLVLKRQEI